MDTIHWIGGHFYLTPSTWTAPLLVWRMTIEIKISVHFELRHPANKWWRLIKHQNRIIAGLAPSSSSFFVRSLTQLPTWIQDKNTVSILCSILMGGILRTSINHVMRETRSSKDWQILDVSCCPALSWVPHRPPTQNLSTRGQGIRILNAHNLPGPFCRESQKKRTTLWQTWKRKPMCYLLVEGIYPLCIWVSLLLLSCMIEKLPPTLNWKRIGRKKRSLWLVPRLTSCLL